jgi:hypothetical protein
MNRLARSRTDPLRPTAKVCQRFSLSNHAAGGKFLKVSTLKQYTLICKGIRDLVLVVSPAASVKLLQVFGAQPS